MLAVNNDMQKWLSYSVLQNMWITVGHPQILPHLWNVRILCAHDINLLLRK